MSRSARLRFLLGLEAAAFLLAGAVHGGWLIAGYEHARARTAEWVIAGALLCGLFVAVVAPGRTRGAALAAQGFALLGTLVGLLTVALGVGPRTVPDLVYHLTIVVVLAAGLAGASRSEAPGGRAG